MTIDQLSANQIEVHTNSIRYVSPDGKVLGEVTFPSTSNNIVDINHTFVDESLRGQGVASMLLKQAVHELDETGRKARITCPYAKTWFKQHPEWTRLVA